MLNIVVRTLILYTAVVVSLRIMGKRQIGELQPSELVVAIMISDLASVPMQAIDIPIISGILPVITLIIAEVLMSYLSLKSRKMRKIISGEPSIVIYGGRINEKELEKLRFNINDLLAELRLNGCFDISEVEAAIIETSGKLSVISKSDSNSGICKGLMPCTVIADGEVNESELARSGKDYRWLVEELRKNGINDIGEVFIASVNAEGKLYLQERE